MTKAGALNSHLVLAARHFVPEGLVAFINKFSGQFLTEYQRLFVVGPDSEFDEVIKGFGVLCRAFTEADLAEFGAVHLEAQSDWLRLLALTLNLVADFARTFEFSYSHFHILQYGNLQKAQGGEQVGLA